MKLKIQANNAKLSDKELFSISITNKDFHKYYNIVTSRFIKMSRMKNGKEEFMNKNYVCDIDAIYELKIMSLNTLDDIIKTIFTK